MWYSDDGHWVAYDPSHSPPVVAEGSDAPATYGGYYNSYRGPVYGYGYYRRYYPGVAVGVGPDGNVGVGVGPRVGVDVSGPTEASASAGYTSAGKAPTLSTKYEVRSTEYAVRSWRLCTPYLSLRTRHSVLSTLRTPYSVLRTPYSPSSLRLPAAETTAAAAFRWSARTFPTPVRSNSAPCAGA